MKRIIISYDEKKLTELDAMEYIYKVIENGRLSESGGKKIFCFITSFKDGTVVETRENRVKADSFIVYRRNN